MMKSYRSLYLASAIALMSSLHAEVTDEDIESLRDWINSQRMVTVKELGGALAISGDVRAEMQSVNEIVKGKAQRGRDSETKKPSTVYDIELNLALDYRTDWTWASARMRFDNDAGIVNDFFGSGTNNKIKVDRAYFGVRIYDHDRHTMDVEVGRRPMFYPFDSRLEFGSNFDGVTLKDSYAFDKVGDFYYQLGAFLVNEKVDQAAYVGEIGLLNIARTGFYTKYSLIDWDTKKLHKVPEQMYFIVSQLLLGYKFVSQPIDKIVNIYLAGLYNHRAEHLEITRGKRSNFGGYLGFTVGQLKQRGDWSLDTNYQVLAAQCVPDFDTNGIGTGNANDYSFYYHKEDGDLVKNTHKDAQGNVNYRGFEVTLQYMLTNNLNLFQQWKQSITLDRFIGPFHKYKQYEAEFIYSF